MPQNIRMINCNRQNYSVPCDWGFTGQGLKAEYRRKAQRVKPGDRTIFEFSWQRCSSVFLHDTALKTCDRLVAVDRLVHTTGWYAPGK